MKVVPEQNRSIKSRIHSLDIHANTVIALDIHGKIYTWGHRSKLITSDEHILYYTEFQPTLVEMLSTVRMRNIACGDGYFVSLSYDGYHTFIWGEDNIYNASSDKIVHRITGMNLGLDRKIKKLISGTKHVVFLLTNGEVWGLGDMFADRIFPEDEEDTSHWQNTTPETMTKPFRLPIQENIVDIECGDKHTLYLDEKGDVFISGYYTNIENEAIYKIVSDVDCIYCGQYSSLFYRNNGKIEIMGENANGELSTKIEHIPVLRHPTEINLPL